MIQSTDNDQFFGDIVKNNYTKVFRLCMRYFCNQPEAEDATQEVFIKVWSNINKVRGEAAISTWIYRIASNVCLTSLRKLKRSDLTFTETGDKEIHCEYPDETAVWDIEEAKVMFITKYQQSLAPEDRSIMALYLEEVESKTIAEITGLSDSNIRTRIHRIKKNIKNEWEKSYGIR
jgi:RNA polymerase sigma-70 factor, ECF subfamily